MAEKRSNSLTWKVLNFFIRHDTPLSGMIPGIQFPSFDARNFRRKNDQIDPDSIQLRNVSSLHVYITKCMYRVWVLQI